MAKHKNLVFIFSDQQRYDTMACYGNDWIKTPRLNEISEESFIFERAYVSQPVCSPARATILTGLYPHTAGLTLNSIPSAQGQEGHRRVSPRGLRDRLFRKVAHRQRRQSAARLQGVGADSRP